MSDISIKYSFLNQTAKQEIINFIDFLLSKGETKKQNTLSAYKKKILQVSTWKKSDLKIFEENKKLFSQWKTEKW